ncbi:MAG TPA: FG-GAP-like repeat-containing protein, partial [Bacteroidales bacterium]
NRLMVVKYQNGDNGSQYVTENETYVYSEITLYQKWTGTEYIPDRWVVKTKSGTTFEYGNQDACLSVRYEDGHGVSKKAKVNWLLNRAEDIYGNFMTYNYEQRGLNTYIKKITYGSNKNNDTKNYNTVEFFYKQRTDLIPVHYYQANGMVDQLLDRIEVKRSNALFRKYGFAYTIDDFSRLVSVTESTTDGKQLNPTIINWGTYNASDITSGEATVEPFPNVGFANPFYTLGDMNGDGLMDLISVNNSVHNARTYYATYKPNGALTFTKGLKYNLPTFDDGIVCDGKVGVRQPGGTAFGDFNGDGKTEIIVPTYDNLHGYPRLVFNIYNDRSNGDGIGSTPDQIWSQLTASSEVPAIAYADLNNDGIDDIIYIEKSSKDGKNYPGKIHFSSGQTASYSSIWVDFNVYSSNLKPEKICVADFNGDGMQDVMILNSSGYKIILSPHEQKNFSGDLNNTGGHFNSKDEIRLGDFNGDGYPDFIVRKMDKWYLEMNETYDDQIDNHPYTFVNFRTVPLPKIIARDDKDTNKDDDKDNIIVTDFNNDGKSDVIICDATYDKWKHSWGSSWKAFTGFYTYWYKSTGTDLVLEKTAKSDNESDAYEKYFVAGDFNGDGRTELLNYGSDCYSGRPKNQTTQKWESYRVTNSNNESGVVTSVTNGLNQKTEFSYKPLTDSTIYKKTLVKTYPQTHVIGPLYVVNEVRTDNGIGGQTAISHKYEDATLHKEGKGFLGFAKISQANESTNTQTVTSSVFNKLYFTPEKQTTEMSVGGTMVSRTINDYNVIQLDNKHVFPYLRKSESNDFLKNITVKDTFVYFFNYNQNYGYLTKQNRYYNGDFYTVEKT